MKTLEEALHDVELTADNIAPIAKKVAEEYTRRVALFNFFAQSKTLIYLISYSSIRNAKVNLCFSIPRCYNCF